MKVRTKFKCIEIIDTGEHHVIKLEVVEGGSPDNEAYHNLFPDGEIEIDVTNKYMASFFVAEDEYFVDFSQA